MKKINAMMTNNEEKWEPLMTNNEERGPIMTNNEGGEAAEADRGDGRPQGQVRPQVRRNQ
eukprot:9489864-Pyramimonas_sp.AAC.3